MAEHTFWKQFLLNVFGVFSVWAFVTLYAAFVVVPIIFLSGGFALAWVIFSLGIGLALFSTMIERA